MPAGASCAKGALPPAAHQVGQAGRDDLPHVRVLDADPLDVHHGVLHPHEVGRARQHRRVVDRDDGDVHALLHHAGLLGAGRVALVAHRDGEVLHVAAVLGVVVVRGAGRPQILGRLEAVLEHLDRVKALPSVSTFEHYIFIPIIN